MKHQIAIVTTLALLSFGSALVSFGSALAADSTDPQDEPRQCMLARSVDNFHVIDRNHVVLMDRREETFLLGTMRPGCWDIHHAPAIALVSPSNTVCAGGTATLRVMDERCHIVRLEAVTSVEAAVSLVEERSEADATSN